MSVLRELILAPRPDIDLTVVSATVVHHYSGMVPGYLHGAYDESELTFDTAAFVALARGRFVHAYATRLDPRAREVHTDQGGTLAYDYASLNLGSATAGANAPGVAEHAVTVKPMARAALLRERILRLAVPSSSPARVVVVGGGSAAVEVAWAVDAAIAGPGRPRSVSLVEARPFILDGYSDRFRRRAEAILASRGIAVERNTRVETVEADAVVCADGRRLASDLTIWLTGPAASPLFRASGLPVDDRGFMLIDGGLRGVGDARLFGAGDCATMAEYPATPKAGVYAVRQSPFLWRNIAAAIDGRPAEPYRPQQGFLSILNTADGRSLLRYGGLVSHSRWAWWLKDWIDRRFVSRYQELLEARSAGRSADGA